jgi:hypothetical protein
VRGLLTILGVLLVTYCGAGVLLETRYADNLKIEEQFCRFWLCDDTSVFRAASKALQHTDPPAVNDAVAGFLVLLRRDPNFPFHWVDLGDALAAAGRKQNAEYCFRQAVVLAPVWPPILMRAVNFYFQVGNSKAALPLASQILDQVARYDPEIFKLYTQPLQALSEVLHDGLPENPRPARALLKYLIQTGNVPDVQQTWRWVNARGFADAERANDYVSFLLLKHRPQEAMLAWKDYLGPRADDYGKSSFVFNGGFESEFSASPLDWKIRPTEGVEVSRDDEHPESGKWSLRLRYDGKHNLADSGVGQVVVLSQGVYRMRARVRTEGLTTDQGIQLQISPVDQAHPKHWTSKALLGTQFWTELEIPFTAPQNEGVYEIRLIRNPSLKFDNRVAGTLWIDNVRVERDQK